MPFGGTGGAGGWINASGGAPAADGSLYTGGAGGAAGSGGMGAADTGAAGAVSVDSGQAGNLDGSAGSGGSGGSVDSGSAGSAGSDTALPSDSGAQQCPPPPAAASASAVTALNKVNQARLASGAGCATMVQEANVSAQNHCNYYSSNSGACIADAHAEVQGCAEFTGASFGDRMKAAGYIGRPAFECMAFANNPEQAVNQWIESVWHRLPILDPWVTDIGYGNAVKCDTMDFGTGIGTPMPSDTVVVYPYDGQTGVSTSFNGKYEGPAPPAPSTGWPSGEPITVWAKQIAVTEHIFTKDGDATPLEHVWLTSADSSFLRDEVVMYGNSPLASGTSYRVKVTGTYTGGALNLDWTFTTR